mgnify:CR=1 FL=1
MIKTGGGQFDPKEKSVYFIAGNTGNCTDVMDLYDHLLIAVNELKGQSALETLERWIEAGKKVFVDSGIFNLTMEHVRKTGITMDEALALPPDKIHGFKELLDRYLFIIKTYGDDVWGYIELDQGGRENKLKTRAMLQDKYNLRPIPVYHPLNDGWDYFDYLAQRYDRICVGNVVQADIPTRLRLISTIWQRHRQYPGLWIHYLGFTPNEWLHALPNSSCDSSSWLSSIRWDGYVPKTMGKAAGKLPKNFQYVLGSEATSSYGRIKATRMSAYGFHMLQLNLRNYFARIDAEGGQLYPEVHPNEHPRRH